MKTRAAILAATGVPRPYAKTRPLEIADVELEPPGPGEVLVSMRAAGLCHSDLSVIDGTRPRLLPMVLGHEAAGVVEALGEGVRDLEVGDHVVTAFVPSCGSCEACSAGRPALCDPALSANLAGTLLSGARRLRRHGADLHHHLGVSAFATAAVVARNSIVAIDRDVPFDRAALFGCAVITGVGAVVNTADIRPGNSVAVVGLGGVGLAALLGARAREAGSVVAIDVAPRKLELARGLGATHVFDARDPGCAAAVRDATRGGVGCALEMAGSIEAMELALRITRRGGTTVTAGLPHAGAHFKVAQSALVIEERTIRGSYLGSCVPARDIPLYIEWHQAGRLPVEQLLGEHVSLETLNEGFDRLATGQSLRQVLML